MKRFLLVTALIALAVSGVQAQVDISVDQVNGASGGEIIMDQAGPVTVEWLLRLQVGTGITTKISAYSNGFTVSSPDGAVWDTTVGSYLPIWSSTTTWDLIEGINHFPSPNEDTVAFFGTVIFGAGAPPGYNEVGWQIAADFSYDPANHQKTVCLDSVSTFRPGNTWKWVDAANNEYQPSWSGELCYTLIDPNATSAELVVDPAALTFNATEGDGILPTQTFDVSEAGGGNISYLAAASEAWISLVNEAGTTPATVTVEVNASGLPAGIYEDSILVSSPEADADEYVVVTLNIAPPPLVLQVDPTALSYNATEGDGVLPAQTFDVSEVGGAAIDYTASTGAGWIGLTNASGTTPATVSVEVDATGLTAGTYTDSVLVSSTSTDNDEYVVITLEVAAAPLVLQVDPAALTFDAVVGDGLLPAQTFDVSEVGGAAVNYTATTAAGWIGLTNAIGTTPATVSVEVDATGLTAGIYTDSILVASPDTDNSEYVVVTLNVSAPDFVLVVSPGSLAFAGEQGAGILPAKNLVIAEQLDREITFNLSKTQGWLILGSTSGTTEDTVAVQADVGSLLPGIYEDTITVSSPSAAGDVKIPVTLSVSIAAEFVFSPDTVFFEAVEGGADPEADLVEIAVSDGSLVPFIASPQAAYIAVNPATGTTPDTVAVSVDVSALTAGIYFDSILVNEDVLTTALDPKYIYVQTTITEPAPDFVVSPDTLFFVGTEGGANPPAQDVEIVASDASNIDFIIDPLAAYIFASPDTGTTPDTVAVSVDIGGLTPDTYFDSILVVESIVPPVIASKYIYVQTTVEAAAPTARLQVIHNAADTALGAVDVYLNDTLAIPNFDFRMATPFFDLTAGVDHIIDLKAPSTDILLKSFTVNLPAGGSFVGIVNGVADTTAYQANPDGESIFINLYAYTPALESGISGGSLVDVLAFHGVTDAPTVDVVARGVGTVVNDLTYGEFVGYFNVPAASYILDVTTADQSVVAASFEADLSLLGGGAGVLFASGFLTPADDNNGAGFGLFLALPNGNVIELPPVALPCSEMVLSDTLFQFDAVEGEAVTDPMYLPLVISSDLYEVAFTYEVAAPLGETAVTFVNANTNDTGLAVAGSTGDTILVMVNPISLPVGITTIEPVVTTEASIVCDPRIKQFTVEVTVTEPIVASADTVRVGNVPAVPGMSVTVPVSFSNSCPTEEMFVALSYNETWLHIDSVSYADSRVAGFETLTTDIGNDSGLVWLQSIAGTSGALEPGSGNWANLHFSVRCETPADAYPIDLYVDVLLTNPEFQRDCGEGLESEIPEFIPGGIVVDTATNYVCGYVVDTAGNSIAGATVELWGNFPTGAPIDMTTSSAIGSWAFSDFTTVPFDVYAYADGYYPGLVEDLNFGDKGIMIVLTPLQELTTTSMKVDYYCGDNTYAGAPLPVGSVVEAFTPDGLLVGQWPVTTAGSYGFMPVYRASDQFGDDGAVAGEEISFRINGLPAVASGDTEYPAEYQQVQVCLSAGEQVQKTCELSEGWNLISWSVDTESDAILDVLGQYMDNIEVVLGFEQGGLTYDPDLPQFSTLWYTDHLSGYWVKVAPGQGFTLELEGFPVSVSTPIPVNEGWNLVSYLPEMSMAPADALTSIETILLYAYGWDGSSILTYAPDLNDFSKLDSMMSCNGYWVKVSADGELVYPDGGAAPIAFGGSVNRDRNAEQASTYFSDVTATNRWVNLYSEGLTLDGEAVSAGSVIAAYTDDGRKVGEFVTHTSGEFGFMPVYGRSSTDGSAGVKSGGQFYLTVNGTRTQEAFTWTDNGDRISVQSLTSGEQDVTLPDEYSLSQNYPNPFNPTTTISFTLPTAAEARLEIFNLLGHRVATPFEGTAVAGENEVVWDGRNDAGETVSSGVYFYRLTTDTYTETKKMMLLK